VGVAGFVVNDESKVLMVKEHGYQNVGWKLPGGLVDLGEEFGDAAVREVSVEGVMEAIYHVIYG